MSNEIQVRGFASSVKEGKFGVAKRGKVILSTLDTKTNTKIAM